MKPGKPFSDEKQPRKLKPSGLPIPPAAVVVAAAVPEVAVPVSVTSREMVPVSVPVATVLVLA